MIFFDDEYKFKCFQAFKSDRLRINSIMQSLDNNSVDELRILIDDSTDDLIQDILQKIGQGEESIHNAKIDELKERQDCYNHLLFLMEGEYESRKERLYKE